MNRNILTVAIIVFVLAILSVPTIISYRNEPLPVAQVGEDDIVVVEDGIPSIGGPFHLVDQNGNEVSDQDFRGKPILVYFGYTYCPDICPMGLSAMSVVAEELGDKVQPIFITVDPKRDTLEQLALYSQNFHPSFKMLTGDRAEIDQAKKGYRVYAAKASEDRGATDYLMDHSSLIYFMDENGLFQLHFNHQTPADVMIRDISKWLEKKEQLKRN